MNGHRFTRVATALVSTAMLASADIIVVPASQNAVIKTANPATNYNGATLLQECNFNAEGSAAIGGMILANFNLHSYSGWVAVADGSFSNGINWAAEGGYYGSHQLLSNWNQAVVTWENYVGPVNDSTYLNVIGPKMGQIGPTPADSWMQQPPYGWTVSQEVIQAWLNNPGLCYGLAIVPIEPNENNQCFALNGMTWAPQQMPKLVMNIVIPEPAVGVALAGVLLLARRRR